MRLLDRIVQTPEPIVVTHPGEALPQRLPGTDGLAAQVAASPLRYVLADEVTELCTRLAFEENSILGSSVDIIRIPAPLLWIEFTDAARHEAFTAIGQPEAANPFPGRRVGFLVTSDDTGRKGDIAVCWEEQGCGPSVAPFTVEYDLDNPSFAEAQAGSDTVIGIAVRDTPAVVDLFARIRFRLRPEWSAYYAARAGNRYSDVINQAVRPIVVDVPFFAVFCLLLSSRHALRQEAVDRSRLNAARERRGKSPLLDHVELTMNLMGSSGAGHGDAAGRSSPRLHFVRGHLVRRGDTVYWRSPHMRGNAAVGSIHSRTISVHV
jgi:hypothetical protein